MSKVLYLAQFNYGYGQLISFESDRETDKNYMVIPYSKKEILPKSYIYISSRVSKDKPVFETESDAIDYLAEKTKKYIHDLEVQLSKANTHLVWLKEFSNDPH